MIEKLVKATATFDRKWKSKLYKFEKKKRNLKYKTKVEALADNAGKVKASALDAWHTSKNCFEQKDRVKLSWAKS
ncbi:MAG: hypothetical protein ACNI3H_04160 [Halarcobacter ebronensis]